MLWYKYIFYMDKTIYWYIWKIVYEALVGLPVGWLG